MGTTDHNELFATLEAKGEEAVRIDFTKKIYQAGQKADLVQEWLESKMRARSEASAAKRDAREEETLSIAKDANRIASEANDSAKAAALAATAAASAASDANAISRSNRRIAISAAVIAAIGAAISIFKK